MHESPLHMLAMTFSAIPYNKMLGLQLDSIEANFVVMSFDMKPELIGNFLQGILHGGVISSVLDMAGGVATMASAIMTHADKSVEDLIERIGKTSTVDLHIQYLSPGLGKRFSAKAYLTKMGKKISFARMELSNDENVLIATGSATYLVK
jgi:uncharacterized protein (TIGR00369 family)